MMKNNKKSLPLTILAEKPEIFGNIDKGIISIKNISQLGDIEKVVVAEINSIQSVAALYGVINTIEADAILPTIAYTGAEYGKWRPLFNAVYTFKKNIESNFKLYVFDPIILGSPEFWWAINGRFIEVLREYFNFYIPCFGCKLYSYALRIPLCKKFNIQVMVSGRLKRSTENTIHQSKTIMKHCKNIMSSFGIDLVYKICNEELLLTNSSDAKNINGHNGCPPCVFEGNYYNLDSVYTEPKNLDKFFEQFAIPAVARIISKILSGKKVDYMNEAENTLHNRQKQK